LAILPGALRAWREEESRRLKRVAADQALSLQMLKEMLGKRVVAMEQRRTILDPVLVTAEGERCACRC